ncbi:MAG: YcgN family cysteine cluster protein [Hyphomicrobiaceae bacterium]|nr:YcgN family cysteine cluster protein [Hyphomicrobiaceae bacterium]MCC0010277.1 YcgN family cysteine cluster protein [Hyphomicrobiaceae bacterium]
MSSDSIFDKNVVIYTSDTRNREGPLTTIEKDEAELPFWQEKTLDEMTESEWESLCDGCGRCCLVKLEDEDNGDVHLTRLACALLDIGSCRCTDYANRHDKMPDCLSIDLATVRSLNWLPRTCAYRRLDEGRDLAWWHPLVSGSAETVHQAGISVRGWALSENSAREDAYHRFIISDFDDS